VVLYRKGIRGSPRCSAAIATLMIDSCSPDHGRYIKLMVLQGGELS